MRFFVTHVRLVRSPPVLASMLIVRQPAQGAPVPRFAARQPAAAT